MHHSTSQTKPLPQPALVINYGSKDCNALVTYDGLDLCPRKHIKLAEKAIDALQECVPVLYWQAVWILVEVVPLTCSCGADQNNSTDSLPHTVHHPLELPV